MSEPASFVLIEDGQKRYFGDRWAGAFLFRELVWGPDDLKEWLTSGEEDDEFVDSSSGGVVANFDAKTLTWYSDGDHEPFRTPRVSQQFQQILKSAWPGYEITFAADGEKGLASAAGEPFSNEDDDEFDAFADRPETVREAAGQWEDEEDDDIDDEDFEDEDNELLDDDTPCAWVTILGNKGRPRQRILHMIPQELFKPTKESLAVLKDLPAAEVPPEKRVMEGLWINVQDKEIGYWGGINAVHAFSRMKDGWKGWNVIWAEDHYGDQCRKSSQPGVVMTDEEALATILPTILSTKRFDIGSVVGALGGQLKSTAMKATGCLTFVLCIPILLFGYFADKMQAAGVAAIGLVVAVTIVFKLMEHRIKKKFQQSPMSSLQQRDEDAGEGRAPVAGPMDPDDRRSKLDPLLAKCGMPALEKVEPYFDEDAMLDNLLT